MLITAALLFLLGSAASTGTLVRELKNGQYREVVQESQEALRTDPHNPVLHILRGLALAQLNRHAESLNDFNAALKAAPNSLPALEGATQEAYRLRDAAASSLIDRLLAQDPANQPAHAMAAVLDVESKHCASAIAHFERSLPVLQKDSLALTQYGACLIQQDQFKSAIPPLQQAIALRPDSAAARYDLAVAHFENGEPAAALDIVKHLPATSDVLNLQAECLLQQDKLEEAIASLRKAIDLAPKDERNYLDLASLCVDHASYDLGVQIATIGLKNLPDSAKLLTLRGAIQTFRGDDAAAEADFEQATRLQPSEDFGSVGLSLMLQGSARGDEAESVLRAALKAHPDDPGLLYLLGDLLMRKSGSENDGREALQLLSNATRLKPSFAKPHAALGKLYLMNGDAGKARQELQTALELSPGDHSALHHLVLAYRKLGLNTEAAQTAAALRQVLDQERKQEVAHNRIRLSTPPPN